MLSTKGEFSESQHQKVCQIFCTNTSSWATFILKFLYFLFEPSNPLYSCVGTPFLLQLSLISTHVSQQLQLRKSQTKGSLVFPDHRCCVVSILINYSVYFCLNTHNRQVSSQHVSNSLCTYKYVSEGLLINGVLMIFVKTVLLVTHIIQYG